MLRARRERADAADVAAETRTTVINPQAGWSFPRLREMVENRDLIYFLAKKDIVVRYKQTAVGALWAVLQPVLLAGVFSIFLARRANLPSADTPYGLFALTGMTLWLFIATALTACSQSTVTNTNLISKIYFPRIVIPVVAVLAPIIDFAIAFVVLVVALFAYGETPEPKILLAPLAVALAVVIVLGLGVWLSALLVRFRDVSHAVAFALLMLLFITPILYPLSLVPDQYQLAYALNPLVGVLELFRWTVLPGAPAPGLALMISLAAGFIVLFTGLAYFQRAERTFADII